MQRKGINKERQGKEMNVNKAFSPVRSFNKR